MKDVGRRRSHILHKKRGKYSVAPILLIGYPAWAMPGHTDSFNEYQIERES